MAKGNTVRLWRRSLIVLMVLLIAGFGLLIFRLVQLQIVEGETLQKGAVSQQLKDTTISAKRGTIYDCNMKPLAQSANVWTVVLEPAYLTDKEDQTLVANGLAEILGMEAQDIMNKMNPNSYYTILKKKVESDVKDAILQFKTDNEITNGIRLIEDYKRYYPYGAFASAVLGCVGGDNQGLAGLEAYYDSTLTGTAGRLITAKNAIGTDMPYDYEQLVPAEDGYSLVLTIDETIQHFMEKYLEQGIINNDVQNRAAAIMMNVNTGEIYGMAVKGDFDPNDPFTIVDQDVQKAIDALPEDQQDAATSEAIQQQWRNKAVSDTYYPGSVFKIITSAMGLQEGVVDQNSTFVCTGAQMVEGYPRPIHCHVTSGHGAQTFLEALCNSCNPAFIQLGQKVGAEKFWEYYQAFGFSEPTGIDLPGEATDIFFSSDGSMTNADLAVASFGQNFSITPIQMLTAAAAAVNGGKLVQPHVVKQILDSDGNIVQSVGTTVKRQVISEEVSKELCQMLQTNATIGSGKNGKFVIATFVEKLIFGFPNSPRFVVIKITPFAPLTPYTAVAEASFKIDNDSTSFGSISFKLFTSIPSTIIKGFCDSASLAKVPTPRIRNVDMSCPGSPLRCTLNNPGILPPSALLILACGDCKRSFVVTIEIEPVTVSFFCEL